MSLLLKTLQLIRHLYNCDEGETPSYLDRDGCTEKELVRLAPKTLEQLDAAIKAAENQCIVSVFDHSDDMIVEHRLVPSEGSSEVFAELCRKYTGIEDDDVEIAKEDGFYASDFFQISAIHLDSSGQYDQSPGEDDGPE